MGTSGSTASFGTASDPGTPAQTAADAGTEAPWFLVLHAVVLKKLATASGLAEATRIPIEEVEAILDHLEAEEAVARLDADVMTTETGTAKVKAHAARRYGALRVDPGSATWLEEFDQINQRFLQATTDWQTLPSGGGRVPNDHSDPAYDDRVISRLEKLVNKTSRLLGELAESVPRFARYPERLHAAMERVEEGDIKYVSDPLVDSIHTVWFEMHEDILIVLGKERTE